MPRYIPNWVIHQDSNMYTEIEEIVSFATKYIRKSRKPNQYQLYKVLLNANTVTLLKLPLDLLPSFLSTIDLIHVNEFIKFQSAAG